MTDAISLTRKKELLKKQVCFSQFTEEETTELATLLNEMHIAAGETIVTEGDRVDSVYLIASGTVDIRRSSMHEGVRQFTSVATLGPDGAIGLSDTGFYSLTGMRTATVVANTDVVLLRLSVALFHGFSLVHSHVNQLMHEHAKIILGIKY